MDEACGAWEPNNPMNAGHRGAVASTCAKDVGETCCRLAAVSRTFSANVSASGADYAALRITEGEFARIKVDDDEGSAPAG